MTGTAGMHGRQQHKAAKWRGGDTRVPAKAAVRRPGRAGAALLGGVAALSLMLAPMTAPAAPERSQTITFTYGPDGQSAQSGPLTVRLTQAPDGLGWHLVLFNANAAAVAKAAADAKAAASSAAPSGGAAPSASAPSAPAAPAAPGKSGSAPATAAPAPSSAPSSATKSAAPAAQAKPAPDQAVPVAPAAKPATTPAPTTTPAPATPAPDADKVTSSAAAAATAAAASAATAAAAAAAGAEPGTAEADFQGPEPAEPRLSGWNESNYCGQTVLLITLRYPPPQLADAPQYLYETFAFLPDVPRYLDRAEVPFAGIAPAPPGGKTPDGVHYPQPVLVKCTPGDGDAYDFHFKTSGN